jgi:hypothetical protein
VAVAHKILVARMSEAISGGGVQACLSFPDVAALIRATG